MLLIDDGEAEQEQMHCPTLTRRRHFIIVDVSEALMLSGQKSTISGQPVRTVDCVKYHLLTDTHVQTVYSASEDCRLRQVPSPNRHGRSDCVLSQ